MRASLSVTTNKILTMTLTGRTSTPRNCHMSHHTCHKVKLKFPSPHVCHLLLHHLKLWKAAYCSMQFEVLELFFEFHHFLDVISVYYCSTFIMQDYYCSAISQLYQSTSDNHIVYMLNYEQRFATFGWFFFCCFPLKKCFTELLADTFFCLIFQVVSFKQLCKPNSDAELPNILKKQK